MTSYLADSPDIEWSDGQPFSQRFTDHYWAKGNPLEEKAFVFPAQHDLQRRLRSSQHFTLAELGFGFGHNFVLTAEQFLATSKDAMLHYYAFERFPPSRATLNQYWASLAKPMANRLLECYPSLIKGWFPVWFHPRIRVIFVFEDVNQALPELEAPIDAWYLDGFKPATNTDIFNPFVFHHLARTSKPGATLSSFTVAASVRHGLMAAGFEVQKRPGFGTKRELLFAHKPGVWTPSPRKSPDPIVVGNGLAGTAISQALTRFSTPHQLVASRQIRMASHQPAFNVYPQLSLDPDDRARFSLAAHHFTRLHAPEFELAAMRWSSNDPARQLRMKRLAERLPRELLSDHQDYLEFPSAGILHWRPAPAIECDVRQITFDESRWMIRTFDNSKFSATTLILATGAQSTTFLPWSMKHIRGQSMKFRTSTALPALFSGDFGLTRLDQDLYLIGSTYTLDDLSTEPRDEDRVTLSAKLAAFCPEAEITPIAQYTGVRIAYPDRMPGFGESFTHHLMHTDPCEDDPTRTLTPLGHPSKWIIEPQNAESRAATTARCFVSTGFGSHGATHAGLAGESIAEELAGAPQSLPRSMRHRFRPDRFDPNRPRKS